MSNEITRRKILEGMAATGATFALAGCSGAGTIFPETSDGPTPGGNALSFPQPVPVTTFPVSATITQTSSNPTIPNNFMGLSYSKSNLQYSLFYRAPGNSHGLPVGYNSQLVALLKNFGGHGVLRFGGTSVDTLKWGTDITATQLQNMAMFMQQLPFWQVLYGINLGGYFNVPKDSDTGTGSPTLAASEVASAYSNFGNSQMLGYEIGNEPDGYNTGTNPIQIDSSFGRWTFHVLETGWDKFHSAIMGQTPGATTTGIATGMKNGWLIPVCQDENITKAHGGVKNIDLATEHYYKLHTSSGHEIDDLLAYPDPVLTQNNGTVDQTSGYLPQLVAARDTGTAAQTKLALDETALRPAYPKDNTPFRIAECNSCTDGGQTGVCDVYASALWVIDFLFDCAMGGATGVNLQTGGTPTNACYSPIWDDGGSVTGIGPIFYGMLLFQLAGYGALYNQSFTTNLNGNNVTMWSIKPATGGLNIVVNNKSAQNLMMTVTLPSAYPAQNYATVVILGAPNLADKTNTKLQNAQVNLATGVYTPDPNSLFTVTRTVNNSVLTFYVPAYSAALVKTS